MSRGLLRFKKHKKTGVKPVFCGSWLACDDDVSVDINAECPIAIAGKPAPTVDRGSLGIYAKPASVVGTIKIPARKPFFTFGLGKMMRAPSSSITQRLLAMSSASR